MRRGSDCANSPSINNKIGPRAKCDQVIYEAIAKATEIIVRGRCEDDDFKSSSNKNLDQSRMASAGGVVQNRIRAHTSTGGILNNPTGQPSHNSSSARFNLEVDEVESVRKILQMWKHSLHVPLRLDIYYEYTVTDHDQKNEQGNNDSSMVRKELLERWCIDYVASSIDGSSSGYLGKSSTGISAAVDDSIAQLRLVCKRIVVMLRVLHSCLRIMPAFRLHQTLKEMKKGNFAGDKDTSVNDFDRRYESCSSGYYVQKNCAQSHSEDVMKTVGGTIRFNFHASESDGVSSEAAFLSLNTPFSRRDLNSIPTPYGTLRFCVLYDSSLNVKNTLLEASERLSKTPIQTRSRAIPINRSAQHNTTTVDLCKTAPHSFPAGTNENDISNHHIIHDYATSPSLRSRSFSQHAQPSKLLLKKSHSSIDDSNQIKQRRESFERQPEQSYQVKERRELSGISLALLNEKEDEESSSPILQADSCDDPVASRQRRAFHHPPPSFDSTAASSSMLSNHQNVGSRHRQLNPSATSPYAYGYNNGRQVTMSQCIRISPCDSSFKPADVSAHPTNTPPIPAFIGSIPRLIGSLPVRISPVEGTVERNNVDPKESATSISPPFINPIKLVEFPVKDSKPIHVRSQHDFVVSSGDKNEQLIPTSVCAKGDLLLPPISSIDVLANNPFTSCLLEKHDLDNRVFSHMGFRQSRQFLPEVDMDLLKEMPFAISPGEYSSAFTVGDSVNNIFVGNNRLFSLKSSTLSTNGDETSSALSSSQALTDLAHRCAVSDRLRTFSDTEGGKTFRVGDKPQVDAFTANLSSLRDQLEQLRTFGDSLTA